MVRAGIFIGVDRTGGLQQLRDAASGAQRMHDWAVGHGIEPEHAILITDRDGAVVEPDHVFDAIAGLLNGPGVDQLIVYFAGHGVNIARNEHWLLTEAPTRASAAIDVSESADAARYCGIRHVVFVSDACRVAPEGIQAQGVRGQMVFPNDGLGGAAQPVDLFYACLLGRTAAEIADPAAAVRSYRALYTDAVLDALGGARPEVLERSGTEDDPAGYVRPRRLKQYLRAELPTRIRAMQLATTVSQEPDAIITSDVEWLARFDPFPEVVPPDPAPPGRRLPAPAPGGAADDVSADDAADGGGPVSLAPPDTGPLGPVEELTRTVLGDDGELALDQLPVVGSDGAPGQDDTACTIETVTRPFGPDRAETGCGIKVRGAQIADVVSPHLTVLPGDGDFVRLEGGPASVVVTFADGSGTVVPALPGFLTGLTVTDGDLVDVALEPSTNSPRWAEFRHRADEIRVLRGLAASASRNGRFDLDRDEAAVLARRMQLGKGVDPSLAVYAAYAYYDVSMLDRIDRMAGYLRDDLDVGLFDVDLLARRLAGRRPDAGSRVVPATPLRTRGWSLLRSHRVELPGGLADLAGELLDSSWSLYTRPGVTRLTRALTRGEIR